MYYDTPSIVNKKVLPFRYDLAEPFNNNIARVGLYGKSMKIKNRTMNVYKQPLYALLIHLNADDILFKNMRLCLTFGVHFKMPAQPH